MGAFYQPQFTFINVSALRTLPDSEFRNGMSEVVKYGFIWSSIYKLFIRKQWRYIR